MSEAKPTPGPWHTSSTHLGAAIDIGAANGANVALVSGPKENGADEYVANADMIADAGTVFHETGLTPRQLAEQRDKLLAALGSLRLLTFGSRSADDEALNAVLEGRDAEVLHLVDAAIAAATVAKGGA